MSVCAPCSNGDHGKCRDERAGGSGRKGSHCECCYPKPVYDERTCITAAELRTMGLAVPKSIPDEGWVPRASMKFKVGRASIDGGTLGMSVEFSFTEPFRWLELNVTVDKGGVE